MASQIMSVEDVMEEDTFYSVLADSNIQCLFDPEYAVEEMQLHYAWSPARGYGGWGPSAPVALSHSQSHKSHCKSEPPSGDQDEFWRVLLCFCWVHMIEKRELL